MKSILLILGIFVTAYSQAQVWGVPGATWHYDLEEYSSGSKAFYTLNYSVDTIVDNYSCQKIDIERQWIQTDINGVTSLGGINQFAQITRFSGDSVFWYKDNEFFLLYNFGASVGDQWVIHEGPSFFDPECDTTSIVSVLEVGMMNINGENLRYIDLNYEQGQYALSGRAIEKMGVTGTSWSPWNFPFPNLITCDTNTISEYFYNRFRCYTDDNFGTYNAVSEPCDYPLTTLSINVMELKDENQIVKMFDLLGREIQNPKNELVIILYSDGSTEKKFVD